MSIVLKIKKLVPLAKVPSYAHTGDAGMDVFGIKETKIEPNERVQVQTGIAMEIPDGYVGLVWDKSGLSHKNGLKVLGGVIDSTYRGEVLIGIVNLSKETYVLEAGHKIAQILIQKIEHPEIKEIAELSDSHRGEKGFGSTGK